MQTGQVRSACICVCIDLQDCSLPLPLLVYDLFRCAVDRVQPLSMPLLVQPTPLPAQLGLIHPYAEPVCGRARICHYVCTYMAQFVDTDMPSHSREQATHQHGQ